MYMRIVQIGRSEGITLPSTLRALYNIGAGDCIHAEMDGSKLVLDLADVRKAETVEAV